MFIFNENPRGANVGDCVIRAICKATGKTWHEVYTSLCIYGFMLCDWGDSNAVWGAYLQDLGYIRDVVPNTCPACYTIADFAKAIEGKDPDKIWPIIDELMVAVRIMNPRTYAAVISELKKEDG